MKFFTLTALFLTTAVGHAQDAWPSFQNGGSVSRSAVQSVMPGDIRWQLQVTGYGQSSPVVWSGHVYITSVEGDSKDACHVAAYQLNDGKRLWQHTVTNASPEKNSNYVSRAAPTPVADSKGVICFFEGGNVVALTHDCEVRWERNLVEDYGAVAARHGLSSSLEQNGESVFVWVERSEEPYVLSLNKATGTTRWKTEGLGATSWASPRLVPVDGGQHLVLSAVGSLAGLDPDTGDRLWLFDGISGNSTPSPMPLGKGRFLIGATVGRGESSGGRAAESNGVIQVSKNADGKWTADYLWRAERATSSFASPIVHNDVAFFTNREGVLYGLNANDGEELFAKRLSGSSWATPLASGQQVFFFGRDGKIDIVSDIASSQNVTKWNKLPAPTPDAASPSNGPSTFSGPVLYSAAWVENTLLLRRGDHIFAVDVLPQ